LRLWDLRGPPRAVRAVFVEPAEEVFHHHEGPSVSETSRTMALGSCAFLDPRDPGSVVLVAIGNELQAFDLRSSDKVLLRGAPAACMSAGDDLNDFSVSPDGRVIAAPTDAGEIVIVSGTDLTAIRTLKGGHQNIAGCARFRADGAELFSGGFDERLVLWDPSNGKLRCKLEAKRLLPNKDVAEVGATLQIVNPPFVLSLAVGSNNELGVGLGDGSILVLPHERKAPRGAASWNVMSAHTAPVDAVAWLHPIGAGSHQPLLISAGRDRALRLWPVDLRTSRRRDSEPEPPQAVAVSSLREKPNAVACLGGDVVLVADTSSDVTVVRVRQ